MKYKINKNKWNKHKFNKLWEESGYKKNINKIFINPILI